MKEHPDLFRTLKTKAIARVRVTAVDVEEVKDWFNGVTDSVNSGPVMRQ